MKVLVCGGRNYSNKAVVNAILDNLHTIYHFTALVHGNARGADALADAWALANNIETIYYTADWHKYGRAAGPIRNQEMLFNEKPDLVVAFPGGTGTKGMIELAVKQNVKVLDYSNENQKM